MLRITVSDSPAGLRFCLEGQLKGPWVAELEKCWRENVPGRSERPVQLDLTGLTFLCPAGKACLAALHEAGAEFIAADCLTHELVAEITQGARRRARTTNPCNGRGAT